MLDAVSSENKTVVKGWYKNLTALALTQYMADQGQADTVENTDVVGDVFDDV